MIMITKRYMIMKSMHTGIFKVAILFLSGCLFFGNQRSKAQTGITAPVADNAVPTEYADANGVIWNPSLQDSVFIFCSENPNAGILTSPGSDRKSVV